MFLVLVGAAELLILVDAGDRSVDEFVCPAAMGGIADDEGREEWRSERVDAQLKQRLEQCRLVVIQMIDVTPAGLQLPLCGAAARADGSLQR